MNRPYNTSIALTVLCTLGWLACATTTNEQLLANQALREAQQAFDKGLRLKEAGQYAQAIPLITHATFTLQELLGKNHLEVGRAKELMGSIYRRQGDYISAERLLLEALAIQESALGKSHQAVSNPLITLANLYANQGKHTRAELLYKRALKLRKETFGPDHPQVAKVLNNLANLKETQQDYVQAQAHYEQARLILEKNPAGNHQHVAASLAGLAKLHMRYGQLERAEPLYKRALETQERTLGSNHPAVAQALNDLAKLHASQNRLDEALPLFERAFTLQEEHLRQEIFGLSETRLANALSFLRIDDETIYRLTKTHPGNTRLRHLALTTLLHRKGRVAGEFADTFRTLYHNYHNQKEEQTKISLLRALRVQIAEASHSSTSPYIESNEESTFILPSAFDKNEDHNIRSRLIHLRSMARHYLPESGEASSKAELHDVSRLLENAAQIQELEAQLTKIKNQATRHKFYEFHSRTNELKVFKKPAESDNETTQRLIQSADELEERLVRNSAPFRARLNHPSPSKLMEQVAMRIPQNGVLIEFVVYADGPLIHNPGVPPWRRTADLRYLALIVFAIDHTLAIDLGPAPPIDQAVQDLHDTMEREDSTYLAAARTLYELVFRPLDEQLEKKKQLFLSTDGQLALLPFAALHDGHQFLVDRFNITYLTSGKDMLPRTERATPAQSVVVLADPKISTLWPPLPGAREEAKAIQDLLPHARLLLGRAATKKALLNLTTPGVLHIATHGFSRKYAGEAATTRAAVNFELGGEGFPSKPAADPQLRSGLILAGDSKPATHPETVHADDSWVTAMELASLNLWGTQLVVLSACDTGQGDVKLGQGVYGLRRALVVAGAQTVVTSLWKVNDEKTHQLMELYYRNLLEGQARVAALHSAMRTLRQTQPHPRFWAPFIAIGQDTPLQGLLPPDQNPTPREEH
ncbi:CHAT domain-containing protein [Melittangium boletus]|nr:CHAT domain-containing protein [Melittangium boletus]